MNKKYIIILILCTLLLITASNVFVVADTTLSANTMRMRSMQRNGEIVTGNFPEYDVGNEADYCYQSKNVKIKINVITDYMPYQTLYVADVWIKNIHSFRTCFAHDKYIYDMSTFSNSPKEDGPTMSKRNNAIFAVNGCYNVGLTVHSGIVYGMEDTESSGAIILYKDGSMRTLNTGEETIDIEEELQKGMYHAWQFGPVLIHEGEKTGRGAGATTRHPRTVLGYYEPGHYVFVVCDGRSNIANGMTFDEIRDFMYELGVQEALNLDGGYSSVMTFRGEMINKNTYWGFDLAGNKLQGRPIPDLIFIADYTSCGDIITLDQLDEADAAQSLLQSFH